MAGGRRTRKASLAMAKSDKVERPVKKSEFVLKFASNSARKGWQDLSATIRNPLADSWDFLTRTPNTVTPTNYPLKGELGSVARNGASHQRWQHKPTRQSDARIWFYVEGQTVFIERVYTHHPNQTK